MARVTADEVKDIIDTTLTDDQIDVFITSANLVVTSTLSGEGLADNLLKEIERWFTAHLVAIRDPREAQVKIGEASVNYYGGKMGMGLDFTPYGQQVKVLDTSGKMATMAGPIAKTEVIDI